MKNKLKLIYLIVLISILTVFTFIVLKVPAQESEILTLREIYSSNIYKYDLNNGYDKNINPYAEPEMGWKTKGKPATHPTKVAIYGLVMILNNDIDFAEKHADWLVQHSKEINGGLFFPFEFDFVPYWPYELKAPWNSGLTQGVSLGLFTYLYEKTGKIKYKELADKVYFSYMVPIEQGGFVRYELDGPFIEEYPTEIPTRVLNGSLTSMLAIHDYAVITKNKDAMLFYKKCVKRFEKLLPSYDLTLPEYAFPISSYALAPKRNEILGRFVGDGKMYILSLKLIGIQDGKEYFLSNVDVGTEHDSFAMNPFYIWPDKKNMNWGERTQINSKLARTINYNKGLLNHSPFKFQFTNKEKGYKDVFLEVEYISKDGKSVDMQLFDENEYWLVGKVNNKEEPMINKKERFKISKEFLESWNQKIKNYSSTDDRYLDDNHLVVELVAKTSKSKVFLDYAKRWENSTFLVPAEHLTKYPPDILKNVYNKPVLPIIKGTNHSKHVEYPSVIRIGEVLHLYYCAYGDDNRWRIFFATSKDGLNWTKKGQVFDENNLPFNGNYAFPFVIFNEKGTDENKRYLMYFSAADVTGKPYSKLYTAYSSDGNKWTISGAIVEEGGLDPFIHIGSKGLYELYYSIVEGDKVSIKQSVSKDGIMWSKPKPIISRELLKDGKGFYTIGGFNIKDSTVLLLESTTIKQRHDTDMYISKGDSFIPYPDNPINVDKDWIDKWDAIRYGYNIIHNNGKYYVYYNGIAHLGDETGGQIGRAELSVDLIEKYLQEIK